jgi:hypothetical protein
MRSGKKAASDGLIELPVGAQSLGVFIEYAEMNNSIERKQVAL